MRAGPLSNDKVIDLLNHSFVPVYTSNEDYEDKSPKVSAEERKALRQIQDECFANRTSVGTVHVYILNPQGHAIDSSHVAAVTETKRLLAVLQRNVDKLDTNHGQPIIKPERQSVAPDAPTGSLVLHLVARGQDTGPQGGSWREFPGENWLVLSSDQAKGFLPRDRPEVGAQYDVNATTAMKLLQYFYPQSEDPVDSPWTKIDAQSLKAMILSVRDGIARARLQGEVSLQRNFYPGKVSPEHMHATLLGFFEWRMINGRITSFELVTDDATRDQKEHYAVAVRMETR